MIVKKRKLLTSVYSVYCTFQLTVDAVCMLRTSVITNITIISTVHGQNPISHKAIAEKEKDRESIQQQRWDALTNN